MANYNLTQTGAEVQVILDRVAAGYIYMGTADLTTTPDTTNPNVCYLLTAVGTYTNFGNITHSSGITIALWNGSAWSYQNVPSSAVVYADATPMEGSVNPVQSGGVWISEKRLVPKLGGKNLYDHNNISFGLLNSSNGNVVASTNYYLTDYIPVEGGVSYCASRKNSTTFVGGGNYVGFWNANMEYISALIPSSPTFTTPSNAAYMRVPIYKNYASLSNETMIEKGTSRTSYEIYNPIGGYPIESGAVGLNQIAPSIVDAAPINGSVNLVTSGGVANVLSALAGAQYGGIATPSTIPATVQGHFYLANKAGIYSNFGSIGIEEGETALLYYNGSSWVKQVVSKEQRKKLYVERNFPITTTAWSLLGDTTVSVNNGGLEITCVSGNGTYHFASIPLGYDLDVSNSWFGIDFDVVSAYDRIDTISLIISTYDNYTISTYYSRNALFPIMVNNSHIAYNGNYKTSIALDVQQANRTLSIDKTAIKSVGILIRTKANTDTNTIRINKFFTYRKPSEAQVIVGFDNIYNTQINALNYLKENGFLGTLFFGAASVGGTGRFTLSELKSIQNDGHLLASYGKIYPESASNPSNWYDMTISQKISAVQSQIQWHYENGFGEGARCFSTPAGGYSGDEDILWESGLVTLISGRINYANDGRPIGYYGAHTQGHSCGPSASNANGTQSAGRFSVIDSICNSGGFAIFIFHNVNGEASQDITLQEFKDFVDYVKTKSDAGLLKVITANELSRYELSEP